MSANLEDPAVATGLEKVLIPVSKNGSTKECANLRTVSFISHANMVMFKIFHAKLQHYANQELPDVQAGFRKERGNRDEISNILQIIEKAREFQKNIYFRFINYAKAFDCVDHDKPWKALREMGLPDHLTCLLRNLYAGQEAIVRTLYGTTDWLKMEKGVQQGFQLLPCLLNKFAEDIMRNAGLDELQAGIKIDGRNINNLRYVDDTTLKAKEERESDILRLNIKKKK